MNRLVTISIYLRSESGPSYNGTCAVTRSTATDTINSWFDKSAAHQDVMQAINDALWTDDAITWINNSLIGIRIIGIGDNKQIAPFSQQNYACESVGLV